MSFTTPKTWQYKETLSAADLNTYITDNFNALLPGGISLSSYTPTATPGGSMTFGSVAIDYAKYFRIGKLCFISIYLSGTIGGTPTSYIDISLPSNASSKGAIAVNASVDNDQPLPCRASGQAVGTIRIIKGPNTSASQKFAAGTAYININGWYEMA